MILDEERKDFKSTTTGSSTHVRLKILCLSLPPPVFSLSSPVQFLSAPDHRCVHPVIPCKTLYTFQMCHFRPLSPPCASVISCKPPFFLVHAPVTTKSDPRRIMTGVKFLRRKSRVGILWKVRSFFYSRKPCQTCGSTTPTHWKLTPI